MKKFIFLILTSILFASNTIVLKKRQKETNTTSISEELIIKKWLINKFNDIMPSYLQAVPRENMLNFTFGYDTRYEKFFSRLNIRLLFPEIEGSYQKSTLTRTRTVKIKLLPIFQVYKKLPCFTLKSSLTLENQELLKNVTFNESFYYYTTFTEYKNITTFSVNRFITIDNLAFRFITTYSSTDKNNLKYVFGLFYYSNFISYLRIYGYQIGGERKKIPFIYWHKIFLTLRKTLFHKRYMFIDFTPYIYYSKEYDFHPKLFFTTSLNIKF